jgi:small conductance mechanosensitive channel
MEKIDLGTVKDQIVLAVTQYGGKILLAIVVFIIGRFVIGKISRGLTSQMSKSHIDKDVQPFLLSLISVGLNVTLLLSCAGVLGIETTSFVAILGAAGLAVGLALQGSLANFAGGVLILIFKPYRVGDLITTQGFTGNVESIQIFNTVLVTLDNRTIILPNGPLSTSPVTNISGKGTIRVDMIFSAGNQNNYDAVEKSLKMAVSKCSYALNDKQHDILLTKMTPNSIDFDVRVWTKSETYWETFYAIHDLIKRQFDADGIAGPAINLNVREAVK